MAVKRIHDLDEAPSVELDDRFVLDKETGVDTFKTYQTDLSAIRDTILVVVIMGYY